MGRFDKYSDDELFKKLNHGFNGEEELAEIIQTLQNRGISGGFIGFEGDSSIAEKVTNEYINLHDKLDKKKATEKDVKEAIARLKMLKSNDSSLKNAIITLAHTGRVDALRALERFSKKVKGELLCWAQTAIGECQMFLESKLSDEPKISIKKIADSTQEKSSTVSKTTDLIDYFFQHPDEAKRAVAEYVDGDVGSSGEIYFYGEIDEDMLADWSVFDYRMMNGFRVIENFISDNNKGLTSKQRASFEEMLTNKYGMFEVLEVIKNKLIKYKSVQSGKIYDIYEKRGTLGTCVGDYLICRIGLEDGRWRMIGSNPIVVPPTELNRIIMYFKANHRVTPKDIRNLIFVH